KLAVRLVDTACGRCDCSGAIELTRLAGRAIAPGRSLGAGRRSCETARAEAVLRRPRGRLRRAAIGVHRREEDRGGQGGRRGRGGARRDVPVLPDGAARGGGPPTPRA